MRAAVWRRLIRRGDDRGSYSLELAILAPAVLLLVLLCIQTGLWWHARQVALTAARNGVDAGRALGASPATGALTSRSFLDRFGGSIHGPSVSTAGSTATTVRIEVDGAVDTLLPGVHLHVAQHAEGPRERWIP